MSLKGMNVRVVCGKKAPIGFEGYVFWEKPFYMYRTDRYPKYVRIGIKNEAGEVAWTYERNVEVVMSAAEVAAEEAAAVAKLAEDMGREALLAKFDWSKVVTGKEAMEAYGGHWDCGLVLPEDVSDEEAVKAVRAKYPSGSSWGALRWARGASNIKVSHYTGVRIVEWTDGYGMCD